MKKVSLVLTALCASLLTVNSATANNSRLITALKYSSPVWSYVLYHAANYNNKISGWWRLSRVKEFHEEAKFFVKKNTRETLSFLKKGKNKAERIKNEL